MHQRRLEDSPIPDRCRSEWRNRHQWRSISDRSHADHQPSPEHHRGPPTGPSLARPGPLAPSGRQPRSETACKSTGIPHVCSLALARAWTVTQVLRRDREHTHSHTSRLVQRPGAPRRALLGRPRVDRPARPTDTKTCDRSAGSGVLPGPRIFPDRVAGVTQCREELGAGLELARPASSVPVGHTEWERFTQTPRGTRGVKHHDRATFASR